MIEETKKCMYCGEEILSVAKKCKFCGQWLDGRSSNPLMDFFCTDKYKNGKNLTAIIATFILTFLVFIFLISTFFDDSAIRACAWALIAILNTLWIMIFLSFIKKEDK